MQKNRNDCGADRDTPSVPQYFSWINNTNEGSTEAQTLVNLDFFAWLQRTYGMQIRLYAWDAGNYDGAAEGFGDVNGEKFRSQYPEGYAGIAARAKELGIRMGLWGSPDGFGDTPESEAARFNFFVHLCRDYGFGQFKIDGVCGGLRPEKAGVYAEMLRECRKYVPGLIVLNHRLKLYEAEKHVTTFLWNGEETYTDVFAHNRITAMHNRAYCFSRGRVPGLDRLAEDHGVCISSSIDYFEDDLIYQAFGRCLILAPEIYGNPWLMRDGELPRLARIYNLHRRNAAILTNGIALDGILPCDAVARGSGTKRFIVTGNDSWRTRTVSLPLDGRIGLTAEGLVTVNLHHPCEETLGTYRAGDTLTLELMPFRACLIEVSVPEEAEPMLPGISYEIVRESPDGTPVEVRVLRDGSHDIREKAPVFLGSLEETVTAPANGEQLYEAAVFAADNDALEARSLRRSGPTAVPEVQACRDAFFGQKTYILRGCESAALFDGKDDTFFDGQSRTYQGAGLRLGSGCLRVDFGAAYEADTAELDVFSADEETFEVKPQLFPAAAETSADLARWNASGALRTETVRGGMTVEAVKNRVHTLYGVKGKLVRMSYAVNGPVRYLRIPCPPDRIYAVRLVKNGAAITPAAPHANNLQRPYAENPVRFIKTGRITVPAHGAGMRLAVALNGPHGDEAAFVAVRRGDALLGCPGRAPAWKANVWEHRVCEEAGNYTCFFPLDGVSEGETLEISAVFTEAGTAAPEDMKCDVWLCDAHR